MRHTLILIAVALALPLLPGCNEDQKPTGFRERQNSALSNPYGYSPFNDPAPPISGGGITDFNKGAFKRDVDSVFNPR